VLLIADIGRPNGIITQYNVFVNSSLVSLSLSLYSQLLLALFVITV